MNCPLCNGDAPQDDVWTDKDECSITDYRCENGHLVQFIMPQNWMTVLILTDDGDELYQLHFDDQNRIIKILDWDTSGDKDMEGTGVQLHFNSNPTQEATAMTTYAKALNALTDSQLIDALNSYHHCKLDLTDPVWRATVLKYARENWALDVDVDTGSVSVMGEEHQSGFGEFVTFEFKAITWDTRWADLKLLTEAQASVTNAFTILNNMTEEVVEIQDELSTTQALINQAIQDMHEAMDEMNEVPTMKRLLAIFRKVDADCMRDGADSIPFSDTEYYTEQISNLCDVNIIQAEHLADLLKKFDEFKKTGMDVEDISQYSDMYESHTPGRVYLADSTGTAGLVMESTKDWTEHKDEGAWYMIIGNQQWQTDDLEEVELELFDFAISAGWMDEVETPDCSPAGEPC